MANGPVPAVPVRFYRTAAGAEPAREWLRNLNREDRHNIGLDLMRVQYGWPIGMPLVRSLKGGLWEVRCTLPSQRIARVLLCFHRGALIVLHGFIKKTQKTASADLALARRRMKEVKS
ncbi:MAG TPA: type II toxin-antitoxin system RelE/ParE family toxin [Candidatus Angelobacter sp.]|nr:type II toxin-antitoxin system RelE/ParE family toxin [Candidatus Angelobacter sp.]